MHLSPTTVGSPVSSAYVSPFSTTPNSPPSRKENQELSTDLLRVKITEVMNKTASTVINYFKHVFEWNGHNGFVDVGFYSCVRMKPNVWEFRGNYLVAKLGKGVSTNEKDQANGAKCRGYRGYYL